MNKLARRKSQGQWWVVEHLIAGLRATPTQKYLLTLVNLHTNKKRRYAFMSQANLAEEMCVDVSTVERVFRWAKKLGIVGVRSIRTGPKEQHNEYWLNIERMARLQANTNDEAAFYDPASVTGQTAA